MFVEFVGIVFLIVWAIQGYEREAQKELRGQRLSQIAYEEYLADFDAYIEVLENCFYE